MRWSLERMSQELREPQPGGILVAQQLAYMLLVQALRLHLAEGLSGGVGWLFALADGKLPTPIGSNLSQVDVPVAAVKTKPRCGRLRHARCDFEAF